MKQIKVSEATEIQLDWMVAKALGLAYRNDEKYGPMYFRTPVTKNAVIWGPYPLPYSTEWSQGGPIIEQWAISLCPDEFITGNTRWCAVCTNEAVGYEAFGPTPLIAAMRCYCCSILGDEVDIPEELCQQQSS